MRIKTPPKETISIGGVNLFKKSMLGFALAGITAGAINGLFGAGGGMVLIPLLATLTTIEGHSLFAASVAIMLPICLITLCITLQADHSLWNTAMPYLIGSAIGGIAAGLLGRKIPTKWLHRTLGILIIWGGVRYLC